MHVDASIGVRVTDPDAPLDPQDMIRDVDVAMYEAKNRGRGQIVRFDVALRDRAESRLELENTVRLAVANDELVVHYQPLVRASDRALLGLEALVRWQHPTRGLLGPAEFLAVAEQNGLSARIEDEVLGAVLTALRSDPSLPRIWINLSVLELSRPRHRAASPPRPSKPTCRWSGSGSR